MNTYELAPCPACTTSEFRVLADESSIKRQMEQLWEFHTRRISAGAPVQQFFDRAIFSQDPPFHLVQCIHCGTVLRNPRESASGVVENYATEAPPQSAFAALFEQQLEFYRPRVRKLTKLLGRTGAVLEVGSYVGAFLRAAQDTGWHAEGIDVNDVANEFAAARGCNVRNATIEAWHPDRRYDVVALWNCFDQLPDPRAALGRAHDLLNDDGLVALRIPNGGCYAALLHVPFGQALLAHNNLLGFPYRNGFTVRAMQKLLGDAGFAKTMIHGDVLVSTASRWTKNWSRLEERAVKLAMRAAPRRLAPWLELYAWKQ